MRKGRWRWVIALVPSLVGGCGGALLFLPLIGPASQVQRVKVSPASATLGPGESLLLKAAGYSILGNKVPTGSVYWTAEGDTDLLEGGTIKRLGSQAEVKVRDTLGRSGTVVVLATAEGKTGQATIQIDPHTSTQKAVEVYPALVGLTPGFQQRFVALVWAAGTAVSAPSASWRVEGDIGTIDSQGWFTATGMAGRVEGAVIARLDTGEEGEAEVMVRPATDGVGEPVQISVFPESVRIKPRAQMRFVAVAVDQEGDPIPAAAVEWSVSKADLAAIDAEGVFTAFEKQGSLSVGASLRTPKRTLSGSAEVDIVP